MKSAIQQAFGMDIHNEEIRFHSLQSSDNNLIWRTLLHFRRDLVPIPHIWWREIFQFRPSNLHQNIAVPDRECHVRVVDDMKQSNLRTIILSYAVRVIQRIRCPSGEISRNQNSAEGWFSFHLWRYGEKGYRTGAIKCASHFRLSFG